VETLDTDEDSIPDNWELFYGLDPNDPSDAESDADGDGLSNLEEFLHGTDPTDGTSVPAPTDFFVERGSGCLGPYPGCGTEANPFDDIDQCAELMVPGDTCWVLDGIYTKGADYEDGRPYQPANSGTENNPISFRAYPGHKPLLRGESGVTWDFGTGDRRDYITYDGFRVDGVIRIHGDNESSRAVGVVVENFEICHGGGKDDGNWSGIFAEYVEDLTIRNNVIRDISAPSGHGQKGMSIFNGRRTLVEHNLFLNNPSEGVFDKEGGEDNVYRRNVFQNNTVALKINNQSDGNGVQNERTGIYENLFICSEDGEFAEAIRMLVQPTDWDIYNNTGYGCNAIVVRSSSGPAFGGVVFNNIWWTHTDDSLIMWENWNGDDREPDYLDYNFYAPNGRYRENRFHPNSENHFGLTDWSNASHPLTYDTHSIEGNPRFENSGALDFRLREDSPARGAGVFGEDMGAYPRRDGTVIGPSVGISEVETGCFD